MAALRRRGARNSSSRSDERSAHWRSSRTKRTGWRRVRRTSARAALSKSRNRRWSGAPPAPGPFDALAGSPTSSPQQQRRHRRQGPTALGRREGTVHLAPGPVLRRARVGIAGAQGDREAEGPRFADRHLDEAGLPDARLAADQEDATPAAPGVREAGAQRAELALAPDEGDVGHAR